MGLGERDEREMLEKLAREQLEETPETGSASECREEKEYYGKLEENE